MKMKINGQTLRDKSKFLQRRNGRLDLFDFLLKHRGPKDETRNILWRAGHVERSIPIVSIIFVQFMQCLTIWYWFLTQTFLLKWNHINSSNYYLMWQRVTLNYFICLSGFIENWFNFSWNYSSFIMILIEFARIHCNEHTQYTGVRKKIQQQIQHDMNKHKRYNRSEISMGNGAGGIQSGI